MYIYIYIHIYTQTLSPSQHPSCQFDVMSHCVVKRDGKSLTLTVASPTTNTSHVVMTFFKVLILRLTLLLCVYSGHVSRLSGVRLIQVS